MGTFRKLVITTLLAWVFVVGPFATMAAGITWVSSLNPASTLANRAKKIVETPASRGTADRATDTEQHLTIMGTALALLKPMSVRVPLGDDEPAYVRDSINWQFDGEVCRQVVGLNHQSSGWWRSM